MLATSTFLNFGMGMPVRTQRWTILVSANRGKTESRRIAANSEIRARKLGSVGGSDGNDGGNGSTIQGSVMVVGHTAFDGVACVLRFLRQSYGRAKGHRLRGPG